MLRQKVGPATGAIRAGHPAHSWNSNNIATNVLLYHLRRHGDRRANPTRRYQSCTTTPSRRSCRPGTPG